MTTGMAYSMSSAERSRVLVVEDEPIIRRFLEEGLTDAGFHIITAHNGAVALDRVEEHQPDAVLLDLLMPVMDGLELLRDRLWQLPLGRRRILADWMYHDLRRYWGDRDRRGVYSIDEVLHSPALHRLWHDAAACGAPGCHHD